MKTKLILAAIAATAFASTSIAAPMRSHRAHSMSGSEAATKALNQKSLEQASAGSTGTPMGAMAPRNGAMSDSGSAAPMTPDAAPMASPSSTMSPPATPTAPQ